MNHLIRPARVAGLISHSLLLIAFTCGTPALRAQGYTFSTLAGAPAGGANDGTGTAARFAQPQGVAIDGGGNLFVADAGYSVIRKVTATGVVTTPAGNFGFFGATDGVGINAHFYYPFGLAFDGAGALYVADSQNHTIRKITFAGTVATVTTPYGTPTPSQTGGFLNAVGVAAKFNNPTGVATDSAGNIYVGDTFNHLIRKISPAGVVSTLAGAPGIAGTVDGIGGAARFNQPIGVAVDSAGNVYVVDSANNTIRKITSAGDVSTLAGKAGISGGANGTGIAAEFNTPVGVAVDSSGNLFVTDRAATTIRMITSGAVVTTIGGLYNNSGVADGTGSVARFIDPVGIAVDSSGNLYVADGRGNTIRKGVPPPPAPPVISAHPLPITTPLGSSVILTVIASGIGNTFQWAFNGVAIAGATSATLTVASVAAANAGTYTVRVTNAGGTVTSNPAALAIGATPIPPVINKHPSGADLWVDSSWVFSYSATSLGTLTNQWFKNGNPIPGATGATYTIAVATPTDAGSYTVSVTNTGGTVMSNPGTITIRAQGRINNLSIVTDVAFPGDNFTLGYVIGGSGTSGPKPLIIRAPGPSLAVFGMSIPLADPTLELLIPSAIPATLPPIKIGDNDDWGGSTGLASAMAAVGAFAFSGPTSKDAAIAASITSRDNFVHVSGVGPGTGTVQAEVYDATPNATYTTSTPRLVNVSVLKEIGSNGLTMGFVISHSGDLKVLIRAVGPGLANVGVTSGTLADPKLTLFAGTAQIDSNDNWGGTPAIVAAMTQVGAFDIPTTSRDAAILTTLPLDGSYSVRVEGPPGATGLVVLEVYEVP